MAVRIPQNKLGMNWGSTSDWEGGTVPLDGDVIKVPSGYRCGWTSGFAQSSIALNGFITEPGSEVSFSDTLVIDVNNSTNPYLLHQGSGTLPINGTITSATCETPNGRLRLMGGASTYLTGRLGAVDVLAGHDLGRVYARGSTIDIAATNGSDVFVLEQSLGSVTTRRTMTAGEVYGPAVLIVDGAATWANSTAGYLKMSHPQAVVDWRGSAAAADNLYIDEGTIRMNAHTASVVVGGSVRIGMRAVVPLTFRGNLTITASGSIVYAEGVNEPAAR